VNLLRTTTFAGYHDGVEHYVTAFEFAGGGGKFGSIIPLPGIPTTVERGGDWTLQRLIPETDPVPPSRGGSARSGPGRSLMEVGSTPSTSTVLKGGGGESAVGKEHRFPPARCAQVLDFYGRRSPIFLAAVFDADAARDRGQAIGDGTPVHITIPTTNPWVPIRILALGKTGEERVDADVYLLTDHAPALLPAPTGSNGMRLDHSAPASEALLADLRSDWHGVVLTAAG
jgi:hypothetical protein